MDPSNDSQGEAAASSRAEAAAAQESSGEATGGTESSAASAPRQRKARRILAIVAAVCGLLVLARVGWVWWHKDGPITLADLIPRGTPSLVKATGRVTWKTQPVTGGTVAATPIGRKQYGATMAELDEDGRFTLQTDVDGRYQDGVYPGKYKLVVRVGIPRPAAEPLWTVPKEYVYPQTTPLRFEVSEDAARNHFEFVLEGEAPEQKTRPNSSRKKPAGKGKRPPAQGPSGGGSGGVQAIVKRVQAHDQDNDLRLTREEAWTELKENFDRVDADGDGFVDVDELRVANEVSPR